MENEKRSEGSTGELEAAKVKFYKSLTLLVRVITGVIIFGVAATVLLFAIFMPFIMDELFF